jgi:hypothetical protein
MLYAFFWVIYQRLYSVFKLQTPVNHPEESVTHSEHGENLKSRKLGGP